MTENLIQVGDFEVEERKLFEIAKAYSEGDGLLEISNKLNIHPSDLAELLNAEKDLFNKAIIAKQRLLKLVLYGPVIDRMINVATSSADARSAVSAANFLRNLLKEEIEEKHEPDDKPTNQFNILINSKGGVDQLVRKLSELEYDDAQKIIDVTSNE